MSAALSLPIFPVADEPPRPRTRADCEPGGPLAQRPCPHAWCKFSIPRAEHWRASVVQDGTSCVLDAVDRLGPDATLEDIGNVFGLTRERVRQIEAKALAKLRVEARRQGVRLRI